MHTPVPVFVHTESIHIYPRIHACRACPRTLASHLSARSHAYLYLRALSLLYHRSVLAFAVSVRLLAFLLSLFTLALFGL